MWTRFFLFMAIHLCNNTRVYSENRNHHQDCRNFVSIRSLDASLKCCLPSWKIWRHIRHQSNISGPCMVWMSKFCKKCRNNYQRRHRRESQIRNHQIPLPKAIENEVDELLRKMHFSFSKKVGSALELHCETPATRKIVRAFPRASYRWIHNELPLKIESDRMLYQMGNLIIQGMKPSDTGLYLCQVEYEPKQIKTVGVFSVAVESDDLEVLEVRETEVLKLQCNSGPLGFLYPGTNRTWSINGNIFVDRIPAKLTKTDNFPNASKIMTGNWTCTVFDQPSDRRWTTALYRVKVLQAPSIWENYRKYILENKIYFISVILGIFCFFAVICISAIRQSDKLKYREEQDVDMIKQHLLQKQNEVQNEQYYETDGQYYDDLDNDYYSRENYYDPYVGDNAGYNEPLRDDLNMAEQQYGYNEQHFYEDENDYNAPNQPTDNGYNEVNQRQYMDEHEEYYY